MSAQHTPGPWTAHPEGCAHVPPYVRVAKYWPQAGAFQIIADCSYVATHGSECEANARLIAAAPVLLEFVRRIAKRDPVFAKGLEKQHIRYAADLVAKAEGRS